MYCLVISSILTCLLLNISPLSAKSVSQINKLHIRSDITLRYARTKVETRMKNPSATESKEMTFSINLPDTAFISNFSMVVNGREHVANVMKTQEAQEIYDKARSDGHNAGLVNQDTRDSKVFSISVNVEAGDKADFYLTFEEQLQRRLGNYEHSISISPDTEVQDFKVEVVIRESLPLLSVSVPEFKQSSDTNAFLKTGEDKHTNIDWVRGSNEATITYIPDTVSQGQLTVLYDVDRKNEANEIQVLDGYFVHFISPPAMTTIPQHTVFVLDISGSMAWEKMNQLKDAMFAILNEMPEHDYFSIITFHSEVSVWEQQRTEAMTTSSKSLSRGVYPADEENKNAAIRFVNSLEARGWTNINQAMLEGLAMLKTSSTSKNRPSNMMSMLIFLTDGQPTKGETNTKTIKLNIKNANNEKIPIFGIAFGRDADFQLMKDISQEANSLARRIYEGSDAALQLEEFYKEISGPVLRNIRKVVTKCQK